MHPYSISRFLQQYQKNNKRHYDLGHHDLEDLNTTNKTKQTTFLQKPSFIDREVLAW
jgi:hypothetical protein